SVRTRKNAISFPSPRQPYELTAKTTKRATRVRERPSIEKDCLRTRHFPRVIYYQTRLDHIRVRSEAGNEQGNIVMPHIVTVITGASGILGQALVEAALARGDRVA